MRNAHYRTGNMARNTENRGGKKQSVGYARWGETLVNLEKGKRTLQELEYCEKHRKTQHNRNTDFGPAFGREK